MLLRGWLWTLQLQGDCPFTTIAWLWIGCPGQMEPQILVDLRSLIPSELAAGLSATYDVWQWLPFFYVFIGHCLFCAMAARELRDRCLVHYVVRMPTCFSRSCSSCTGWLTAYTYCAADVPVGQWRRSGYRTAHYGKRDRSTHNNDVS